MTFENPHQRSRYTGWNGFFKALVDVARWKLGHLRDDSPHSHPPDDFQPYHVPAAFLEKRPWVVWVNHSSFLVHVAGATILTDPIFSKRCSPFALVGPKRRHSPGLKLKELPQIDYVLVSHNHYDHLDKKAVTYLKRRYPNIQWLVPSRVKVKLERWGVERVIECNWWEEATFLLEGGTKLRFTAVPAQHFSGRSLFDFNKTLWCGWVGEIFEGTRRVKSFYFVGDTGYNAYDFAEIGKRFSSFDLSLIPIGCYSPRRFLSPVHIEPHDAVKIHREVSSRLSIGMHWKTFRLSDEPMVSPPYDLKLALEKIEERLPPFIVLEPGQRLNW